LSVLPEELYRPNADDPLHAARAEMTLVHNDLHPLSYTFDSSPMWRFVRSFLKLDFSLGERAIIAIDLLPLTPSQRKRHRKRLARKASRQERSFDPLGFLVGTATTIRGEDESSDLEQSIASQALAERLKQLENAFRLQVLIRVEARGKARAEWILEGMVASFGQFTARNAYEVHGYNLGFAFLTSADLPVLRQFFDYRVRTGFFWPLRDRVVSGEEMQWFTGPLSIKDEQAAQDNYAHRLMGGQPIGEIETFQYQPDALPTGLIYSRARGIILAGAAIDDNRLSFTAGKSGCGKSEYALNEFVHLARSGHGTLLLHPHPHNMDRIRPYLTTVADRVIEVNLAGRPDRVPGWNPFSMAGRGSDGLARRHQAIMAALSSTLRWGDPKDNKTNRTQAVARAAIQSLLELSTRAPSDLSPTIFQLPTIILDANWRRAVLPFLSTSMRQFWLQSFANTSEEVAGPLIELVEQLRTWPAAAAMLSAPESTYDARRNMDNAKAVMLCTGGLDRREDFVANLFAFDVLFEALGREALAPSGRVPFYPILDQIEIFDRATDDTFAFALEKALQFNVFPHLICGRPASLRKTTQHVIFSHDTRLATGALDPESSQLLEREWTWGVYNPADILTLDRFAFLFSQVGDGRVTAMAYQGTTVPLGYLWRHCRNLEAVPAAAEHVRQNSGGYRVESNLAELEVLDERIRRWAADEAAKAFEPAPEERPEGGPDDGPSGGESKGQVIEFVKWFGRSGKDEDDGDDDD
jgi:hypothetical protein